MWLWDNCVSHITTQALCCGTQCKKQPPRDHASQLSCAGGTEYQQTGTTCENIRKCCMIMLYVSVLLWNKELMKLDKAITIQSQIMMKLKPMKSPSTPPQSATREPKEKASSSLITWMDPLENFGTNSVDSIGCLDSSTTYFEINLLFWFMIF